ncbi:hypothetical protein HK097_002714 [Rhizophlyctis rosea]|uniref:Uncharacterized protein n=1 Tax=Rhizophlyctis rosea TaxID=64517 RepID=A0AAD5X361_9FUNG|nr:hypothetical protein HK097_002714 [Rhizophlyctis rosea]
MTNKFYPATAQPAFSPRSSSITFYALPVDVISQIIFHIPDPSAFVRTSKSIDYVAKDPVLRAKWILRQIRTRFAPPPPRSRTIQLRTIPNRSNRVWPEGCETAVMMGLLSFLVGARKRILNEIVVRALERKGVKFPSVVGNLRMLPPPNWLGSGLLAKAVATKGNGGVAKLAIGKRVIRNWAEVVQSAEGCGNKVVKYVVLDYIRDLHVQKRLDPPPRRESITESTKLIHNLEILPRRTALQRKRLSEGPPAPLSLSTYSDPYLTELTVSHTLRSSSLEQLLALLLSLPPTSTHMTRAFFQRHIPSETLFAAIAPAVLSDHSAPTVALKNLRDSVVMGLVEVGMAGSAGILVVRRACLDGKVDVVERLIQLGVLVDHSSLERQSFRRAC